jgi:hypothetical protein
MSEQPQNIPEPEPTPQKLQIDDPSNFQFHAAFMVYSEIFDNIRSDEVKKELNLNIEELKENQIDAETFYRNVARYRGDVGSERRHDRLSVQTQRKRDWRMKSQKQDRIRRHKK